ncbi:MAG: AAA family ATPase [Myxococcota bacterium]
MGRIVSVSNQKGGVGKTTTAVNLGASLAAAGRKVLVIDMDPQANAGSGLGIYPDQVDQGIYQALMGDVPLKAVIRPTQVPNLFLAPSTKDLAGAEIELVGAMARETRLRNLVRDVRDDYDFVLLDCPPSLGLLTINCLCAADSVLIPLQCEYYALEGLGRLLETIDLVKSALHSTLTVEGVLFTMFDARNNLARQVVEEVRSHFEGRIFNTMIPRNVRLSEAPSHGQPAILYDAASRGSQGYLALADEMLGVLSTANTSNPPAMAAN